MQNQQQVIEEATRQILDAYDHEQFRAIPYIVSGWATAYLGDCMMSRVLGASADVVAAPGDVVMHSPTKVAIAEKLSHVPELTLAMRPAISLRKRPDDGKIASMLYALQVGVDRLFYSALCAKGTVMSFGGFCNAAERLEEEDGGTGNRFAFTGSNVSRSFAHNHAAEGAVEDSSPEHKVLPHDTMVLARFDTHEPLGMYSISPARVELPIGLAGKEGWEAIKIIYGDTDGKILKIDPLYSDRLEFSLVVKVAACIMQPERFIIVNNCALENPSDGQEGQAAEAGYVPGSTITH